MRKNPTFVEYDDELWSDDTIFCPYCKAPQQDIQEISGAYTEDGGETDCGRCGKPFRFSTNVSFTWTSYKEPNP